LFEDTKKFPKTLKLVDGKEIAMLFQQGKRLKIFPFNVFYLQKKSKELKYNKVLFAVSKKRIRSAVQRNKVKRLCREAYRLHKHILNKAPNEAQPTRAFLIGYVYIGSPHDICYAVCSKAMTASLQHLKKMLPLEQHPELPRV
jgi:ribonuclease P protein component